MDGSTHFGTQLRREFGRAIIHARHRLANFRVQVYS